MRKMTEKNFSKHVVKFLRDNGIYTLRQEGQGTGVSDLIACYKGKYAAIELKGSTNRYDVTHAQCLFLKKIRQSGGISFVIKHSENWKDELMEFLDEKKVYDIPELEFI